MGLKTYMAQDGYHMPSVWSKRYWIERFVSSEQYYIACYVRALRAEEYFIHVVPNTFWKYFYRRRKNRLGAKLGFFIYSGCFGKGLRIAHYGSVIVHPASHIGRNCTIHGNCCIGNNGKNNQTPIVGDNVDIGQNAQLLGGIRIANGVRIGANAVVVKSVEEENVSVVGIPAQIVRPRKA